MAVLKKEEEKELLKILKNRERIEREVSLSWDGSNLLLRLPKEIADYLGVNKENRTNKMIKFIIEETESGVNKTFDIINKIVKNGKKSKITKK